MLTGGHYLRNNIKKQQFLSFVENLHRMIWIGKSLYGNLLKNTPNNSDIDKEIWENQIPEEVKNAIIAIRTLAGNLQLNQIKEYLRYMPTDEFINLFMVFCNNLQQHLHTTEDYTFAFILQNNTTAKQSGISKFDLKLCKRSGTFFYKVYETSSMFIIAQDLFAENGKLAKLHKQVLQVVNNQKLKPQQAEKMINEIRTKFKEIPFLGEKMLFGYKKLFYTFHLNRDVHFVTFVADLDRKTVTIYDSLIQRCYKNVECTNLDKKMYTALYDWAILIVKWLQFNFFLDLSSNGTNEYTTDEREELQKWLGSDWFVEFNPRLVPQQHNDIDCAYAVCRLAYYILYDIPLNYVSKDIHDFRMFLAFIIILARSPVANNGTPSENG